MSHKTTFSSDKKLRAMQHLACVEDLLNELNNDYNKVVADFQAHPWLWKQVFYTQEILLRRVIDFIDDEVPPEKE
jgi:hypothetical protein